MLSAQLVLLAVSLTCRTSRTHEWERRNWRHGASAKAGQTLALPMFSRLSSVAPVVERLQGRHRGALAPGKASCEVPLVGSVAGSRTKTKNAARLGAMLQVHGPRICPTPPDLPETCESPHPRDAQLLVTQPLQHRREPELEDCLRPRSSRARQATAACS